MGVSKHRKEHKNKVNNYKSKIKMSQEQEKIPQIRQLPQWKSQDTIEVSGLEWEAIYNTLNMFRQAIVASESVMQRNTQSGKITMKYIDENDKEVSPEEVEKYTKQLQEYFAKQAKEQEAKNDEKSTRILNSEGETASQPKDANETPKELPTSPGNPLKAV